MYVVRALQLHTVVNTARWLFRRYSDPKLWTAYMGLHDQRDRTNAKVQSRSIKTIIQNPYFNDYTYDYDIAVLELSSPVTFTKEILPICLPDVTHQIPAGKAMWVTGWGATQEEGQWRGWGKL